MLEPSFQSERQDWAQRSSNSRQGDRNLGPSSVFWLRAHLKLRGQEADLRGRGPEAECCGEGSWDGRLDSRPGFTVSSVHSQTLLVFCDLNCEMGTMKPVPDLTNPQS